MRAARADELADAEILWGPVEEDDLEIQELDIVAGDFQRDLLEAALAAADADDVAIDAEADLLLAEQLPILALAHLLGVDGEHRAAAEVVARARGDLDPLDRTGASLQVERLRALAGVELLAQVDLLNLVVAEHDRDADDEDGALRRLEADAGKAAVAASHVDRVAIDTDPADARRAEQHPLASVGIARQAGVARRGAVPIAGPLRGGRVYDCRRQQQQSRKRQDVSAQHSYLPTVRNQLSRLRDKAQFAGFHRPNCVTAAHSIAAAGERFWGGAAAYAENWTWHQAVRKKSC